MFNKPAIVILIFLPVVFISCTEEVQVNEQKMTTRMQTFKTPEDAADKGLQDLMKLADETNFRDLGFESLEEVKNSELGIPADLKTLSYERLLDFREGMSINEIFTPDEQFIYPVMYGNSYNSSVTVEKANDNWKVSTLGDQSQGKMVEKGRNEFQSRAFDTIDVKESDLFIITIPGIGQDFYAYNQNESIMMMPVEIYQDLKLPENEFLDSRNVLPVLSDYVKEFDRKYGDQLRERKLLR